MGWIRKLSSVARKGSKCQNLPSLDIRGIKLPASWTDNDLIKDGKLPNASVIYGIGAGGLFAFAFYSFFMGGWFTGLFLLLPAVALMGFALLYIRHPL